MDIRETPNRLPWPPMLFGLAIVVAIGLQWLAPLRLPALPALPALAVPVLGWLMLAAGAGLDLAAMRTMKGASANIMPHRAATALVTGGPFAFSRNPIYLGNTVMMLGAGLAFGNPWLIPAGLVAALLVFLLAIRREEAHLALRFGADWDAYRWRVSRWFGRR